MKSFVEHLSVYAEYHRDPKNIMTHLLGVPMIVFAVIVILSRPSFDIAGIVISPAIIGFFAAMVFYIRLHLMFGLIMFIVLGAGTFAGASIAASSTTIWLTTGVGLFVVGWIIQFIGHHFEGKKPAFVDDLVGLMIGPLFVTAEVLFSLGLYKQLQHDIEQRAGIVRQS